MKSTIGFNKKQGDVVRSIGLRKINHIVERAGHARDPRHGAQGPASA